MPLLYCLQGEFDAHYSEENFCNVQPKESLLPLHVSVSYEGETFVTRDELKKARTMRQFARKNRITAFLFIETETRMSKREKPKTAVDTKTEKPGILSAKTEKPISGGTKTAKPKNPMSPSVKRFPYPMRTVFARTRVEGVPRLSSGLRTL